MSKRFVIEAVMIAVYGQLLVPGRPVEYLVPYSTISELYELADSEEPVMSEAGEDEHVRKKIKELIKYLEDPFNYKKIQRSLQHPWKKSSFLFDIPDVTFTIVNAVEQAQFGDEMDPVETELVLTAMREEVPLLTDQPELIEKLLEAEVEVQMVDIEDFEYALEDLE